MKWKKHISPTLHTQEELGIFFVFVFRVIFLRITRRFPKDYSSEALVFSARKKIVRNNNRYDSSDRRLSGDDASSMCSYIDSAILLHIAVDVK